MGAVKSYGFNTERLYSFRCFRVPGSFSCVSGVPGTW